MRSTPQASWLPPDQKDESTRLAGELKDNWLMIQLMLATLTDRRDFGDDWLLERKLDGERCVARKEGDEVRLESRTGKELTSTYPEVSAAVVAQHPNGLLLDGEVVAFDADQTSFTRLQQRLGAAKPSPAQVAQYPVVYCVFDLLEVDGKDLRSRPLVERRAQLLRSIEPGPALQHTDAWSDDSEGRFTRACGIRMGGADSQARGLTLCGRPLERLVEVEVCLGAGVRNRWLYRSCRQPDGLWRATRRLLRARFAAICGKGGNRLHECDTPRSRYPTAEAGGAPTGICRCSTHPQGNALDAARARSPDWIRRMDQ